MFHFLKCATCGTWQVHIWHPIDIARTRPEITMFPDYNYGEKFEVISDDIHDVTFIFLTYDTSGTNTKSETCVPIFLARQCSYYWSIIIRAETNIPNIRIFVRNPLTNIRSFANEYSFEKNQGFHQGNWKFYLGISINKTKFEIGFIYSTLLYRN